MANIAIRARLPMPTGISVNAAQWRVLTDAIFPSAQSPESIVLALDYCAARKLDIFKRPVNIVPMWNEALGRMVETVWPGINEAQVTAARTGQWAGMDPPIWGPDVTRKFKGMVGKKGRERLVEVTLTYPESCEVVVWRLIDGQRYAFSEPVFWLESYARMGRSEVPNGMWQKRVRGQLHKVAKAASLRAAFPEQIGNDYSSEEMAGQSIESGGVVIEGEAEEVVTTGEASREADNGPFWDDLPDGDPSLDQGPPPKRHTWADLLAEIEGELRAAASLPEVEAIAVSEKFQLVDRLAGDRVRAEAAALLVEHTARLVGQPPRDPVREDPPHDPETGEIYDLPLASAGTTPSTSATAST